MMTLSVFLKISAIDQQHLRRARVRGGEGVRGDGGRQGAVGRAVGGHRAAEAGEQRKVQRQEEPDAPQTAEQS